MCDINGDNSSPLCAIPSFVCAFDIICACKSFFVSKNRVKKKLRHYSKASSLIARVLITSYALTRVSVRLAAKRESKAIDIDLPLC